MSILLQLPQELLQLLFLMLSRQSLARFSLTCHLAYDLCVPTLYSHLQVGFRAHVRQLEEGLRRHPKLKETMRTYTRTLTLKNQQSSNLWFARDFAGLLGTVCNVRVLTLSDFDSLSVDYLSRLAAVLPKIECLQLHYCNLTHESAPTTPTTPTTFTSSFLFPSSSSSSSLPQSSALFSRTRRLNFCWTDFSEAAAASLFERLPYLESVNLGANRNRVVGANTAAIKSLTEHCIYIKELTVSLQQISESVLCETIAHYGPQLHKLSIRCDGRETLKSVAQHATHVKNLTIRAAGVTMQPPPSPGNGNNHGPILSPTTTTTTTTTTTFTTNSTLRSPLTSSSLTSASTPPTSSSTSPSTLRIRTSSIIHPRLGINTDGSVETDEEEEDHGSIVGILQRCRELVHLEMVSWMVQDVPTVVWRGIDAVALRRRRSGPLVMRKKVVPNSNNNNKTLALDLEELQEIRKQFVRSHLLADHITP